MLFLLQNNVKTVILLLILSLVCVPSFGANGTNIFKALGEPFTVYFDHKPLGTNEYYNIYANRVPFLSIPAKNISVMRPNRDGSFTLSTKVSNLTREGKFTVFVSVSDANIESLDTDDVSVTFLKPRAALKKGIDKEVRADYIVIYYPIGFTLYEQTAPSTNKVALTNIYNPHIVPAEKAVDKIWSSAKP